MKPEEAEKLMSCNNSLGNPKEKMVSKREMKIFIIFGYFTVFTYMACAFILLLFDLQWEIRQLIFLIMIIIVLVFLPFSLKYAIHFWKVCKEIKKDNEK